MYVKSFDTFSKIALIIVETFHLISYSQEIEKNLFGQNIPCVYTAIIIVVNTVPTCGYNKAYLIRRMTIVINLILHTQRFLQMLPLSQITCCFGFSRYIPFVMYLDIRIYLGA
jgi:hypothetical protein